MKGHDLETDRQPPGPLKKLLLGLLAIAVLVILALLAIKWLEWK